MSKWNQVISPSKPDTVNRAGGEAFTETPEVALVNLVLTSFMKDKFCEATKDEQARLTGLLTQVDPQFAAKAGIYARKKFGMRSITFHFSLDRQERSWIDVGSEVLRKCRPTS